MKLGRSLAFVTAVVLLEPFAQHALVLLSRYQEPSPCICIGRSEAPLNIVYLHGLDTPAPSWQEIQNREKLRAIAGILDARIALPRAPGRWPQTTEITGSIQRIKQAANICFRSSEFAVIGFSDGANVVNQLYTACRRDVAASYVSIGSSEGGLRRGSQSLPQCGQLVLIAGSHEPGFETTRMVAAQLARHGGHVRFVAHSGPHEIPLNETVAALRQSMTNVH